MAKIYHLTLTEDQAKMLRYALTVAMRTRREDARYYRQTGKRVSERTARSQALEMDQLRDQLDRAPTTET